MTSADRLIQPPQRSTRFGTLLILAAVLLLSISSFSLQSRPWLVVPAAAAACAALLLKEQQASSFALFTALLIAVPALHASLRAWPYNLLIPIIAYLVVMLSVPRLRRSFPWVRSGRIDTTVSLLVLATMVVSGAALFVWHRALAPDLSVQLRHLPPLPVWLVPVAGLGFSAGNAAAEEFAFRGVVMQATDGAFGPGRRSIVVQAWLFGAAHYLQGFPNGAWGLAMTFVYGAALGVIRRRSQGLLAPWTAHVAADAVIFAILVGSARGHG